MTRSRLTLLALILILAVPPGIFAGHEAIVPRMTVAPGLAAPQESGKGSVTSDFHARKKGDRKGKRRERKERRQERRDRQRPGLTPEQVRIAAKVEAAPPRIPALAVEGNPCGPGLIQLPKSGRCTHGPDPEPPAAVKTAARSLEVDVTAALCEGGDGISGFRVQVLYLRSTTAQDNYTTSLSSIRQAAEGANAILSDSQPGAQGTLNYHFVRNAACEIDVANVAVSRADLLDFDRTIEALEQQNFAAVDRIYLIFADTADAGICGIGTYWPDDRKTTSNLNNRGPSYARADLGCWDGHTAAHELMHNLGAVQDSAPHTTNYGHCFDEYDVMCYRDWSQAPPMQYVCRPSSVFEVRYDCNGDDYFNPSPSADNYLSTHWNTADNWFLTQEIPANADLTPPDVAWEVPVGNGQTYVAGAGAIALRAGATDQSGVDRVEFWLYDASRDDWDLLGEDSSAPYTGSVDVAALRSGLNYLTADAYDTQGNWVDEGIWIDRISPDPGGVAEPAISLATSTARVKAKKRVTLTAAVANAPAGGAGVEFRVCRGGSCTWAAGQSLGVFSGATPGTSWKASGKGRVTFLAQITSEDGTVTSNPATVSVKKVKKKKR